MAIQPLSWILAAAAAAGRETAVHASQGYGIQQADERQVLSHRQGAFQALRTECLLEDEVSPLTGTSELVRQLDGLTAMKRKGITKDPFLGDYVRAFRYQQIELLAEYKTLELSQRRDEFTMHDADIVELHRSQFANMCVNRVCNAATQPRYCNAPQCARE